MADISDVEQAVANAITNVLYPWGPSQSSIAGTLCRVYRGWPNSATLNADLNLKVVNITVVTDNDAGRTTTRYLSQWQTIVLQPGVTANTTNRDIVISGRPTIGDVVGAMISGKAYAYRIQTGDTAGLVAANLYQLISNDFPAQLVGATVTVLDARYIKVRVVHDNVASIESRRQEKDVRVICWCSSPDVRDFVAGAIDLGISQSNFLVLTDGTEARVAYRNTVSFDQAQNALLYRRDLIYSIEYATIVSAKQPSMLFGASELSGNVTYG